MNVLVIYATREGEAGRIAEHVAASMSHRGLAVDLIDAAHILSVVKTSSANEIRSLASTWHSHVR